MCGAAPPTTSAPRQPRLSSSTASSAVGSATHWSRHRATHMRMSGASRTPSPTRPLPTRTMELLYDELSAESNYSLEIIVYSSRANRTTNHGAFRSSLPPGLAQRNATSCRGAWAVRACPVRCVGQASAPYMRRMMRSWRGGRPGPRRPAEPAAAGAPAARLVFPVRVGSVRFTIRSAAIRSSPSTRYRMVRASSSPRPRVSRVRLRYTRG